jgi:hypothetical protein
MAVTINGTNGITFNDATTQASAVSTAYGGIGSYVMAAIAGTTVSGSTYAGSSLIRANNGSDTWGNGSQGYLLVSTSANANLGFSGTWRCMTTSNYVSGSWYGLNLFVRIS